MNTVLRVGVLLLLSLALFGSGWYIVSRLRTTFGLQRPWLLRVLVMAALVGWFMLMLPATKSADVVAGLSYVLGRYVLCCGDRHCTPRPRPRRRSDAALGHPRGPPPGKEVPREDR